ncbi:hypothetical protein LSAT2_020514 [Lamellibrachia satsuma]|nr:hypothetical protein LSAT2_020514 [Lamellibrachia satsuma]
MTSLYLRLSQHVPQNSSVQLPQCPDCGVPPLSQNLLQSWVWLLSPEQPEPPQEEDLDIPRLRLCVPVLPHRSLQALHADQLPHAQLTLEQPLLLLLQRFCRA